MGLLGLRRRSSKKCSQSIGYLKAGSFVPAFLVSNFEYLLWKPTYQPAKIPEILKKISESTGVNPMTWICPFSVSNRCFLSIQFNTRFPDRIACMYLKSICNIGQKIDSWTSGKLTQPSYLNQVQCNTLLLRNLLNLPNIITFTSKNIFIITFIW